MEWEIEKGIEIVIKALDQEEKDRCWDLYLTRYPYMTEENFLSFEEFYHLSHIKRRSKNDLLDEVEMILEDYKWELN